MIQDSFLNELLEEKSKLLEMIEDSDFISFDVYDTLILRDVYVPEDIYEVVQIKLEKFIGKNNFKKQRINYEHKTRVKSNCEEITLDQIYYNFLDNYSLEHVNLMKQLELETELEFTRVNNFMYEVYKEALKRNKKIFFISDMYLEASFISKILVKLGYSSYEELYVSSDIKKTKSTGNLFKFVLEKNKELVDDAKKWMHIGDNYFSDYEVPTKLGIRSYYYKNIAKRTEMFLTTFEERLINRIIVNEIYTNKLSYWERFGIKQAFPIYYSLYRNILENTEEDDFLYFFSRDGYILNKIFNILGKKNFKYIYTSRKVYNLLRYSELKYEEIIKNVTEFNIRYSDGILLQDILKNLNISIDQKILKLLRKNDLKIDSKYGYDIVQNKKVEKFLYLIENLVRKQLKKAKEITYSYLLQEGFVQTEKNVVFDIGWRGSIQSALKIMFPDKNIRGLYLGTNCNILKNIESETKGLLFNKGKPMKLFKKINENIMLYELLFSAPEGSLVEYEKKNQVIYPVLYNVESNFCLYKIIEIFQERALNMLNYISKYEKYIKNYTLDKSILNFQHMIEKKEIYDLFQFSKLTNNVEVGNSLNIVRYVTIINLETYLRENKKYKNLWKNGILIQDNVGRLFNIIEIKKIYKKNRIEEKILLLKSIRKKINLYTLHRVFDYIRKNGIMSLIHRLKYYL